MDQKSLTRQSSAQIVETGKKFLLENYGRLPLAFSRGKGDFLWDADGKKFLDLFSGFGAGGIAGHCHPQVVEAIKNQSECLLSHGNLYFSEPQVELAELLLKHCFKGRAFFCHSGAEANEAAIKLVRKAAGQDRFKIISFDNCFHGRTMGGLSLCPSSFQEGFEPMLPGNIRLPYGDLDAVAKAIDKQTAGIFFEPIQGEGGMNVPSLEFISGLRNLCDENNLLLVCDEVWTAPARTGRWFGFQHYGITPDVVTMAKAVGGGIPLGACLIAEKNSEILGPGSHGCTMGGNPLSASAAVAAIKLAESENLVDRAQLLGEKAKKFISDSKLSAVVDIRGKGLMIGIQLEPQLQARNVMLQGIEQGLLIGVAKQNVIRLAPALTVGEENLFTGLSHLISIIEGEKAKTGH